MGQVRHTLRSISDPVYPQQSLTRNIIITTTVGPKPKDKIFSRSYIDLFNPFTVITKGGLHQSKVYIWPLGSKYVIFTVSAS